MTAAESVATTAAPSGCSVKKQSRLKERGRIEKGGKSEFVCTAAAAYPHTKLEIFCIHDLV